MHGPQRQVAELIVDREVRAPPALQVARQAVLIGRRQQFLGEGDGAGEAHLEAGVDGRYADRRGQLCLVGA